MLRPRTLKRVALAATALAALISLPALAQVDGEHETPGASCPTGAVAGHAVQPDWDTFFECNASGQWQRGPYFFGATPDACDSNHAGMMQWTGSAFQVCNGTSWGPIGVSAALSALTSATASNSLDNVTYAQTWTWNTLTTQTALTLSSSSETTGSLLALTDSNAASSTGKVLSASTATTGAGAAVAASITGSNNTGYGVYANNASTSGWAVYATGGAPSYFAGSVGIGTTSPQAQLNLTAGAIIGPDTNTCTSAKNGEMQYTSGANPPWTYCNGSAWTPFDFVTSYAVFTASSLSIGQSNFVCALTSAGALWCWGQNANGTLATGVGSSTTPLIVPTQAVSAFAGPWSSITAGNVSTCGIKSADSTAWCWGNNGAGQLGNGGTSNAYSSPVAVSGGATWIQIASGGAGATVFDNITYATSYVTCGVKTGNTGWCWGGNGAGNVGDGTTTERTSPVQISGSWLMIVPGFEYTTCGVQTNGTLWCWGDNQYGQLGQGTTDASAHPSPVQVGSGTSWTSVSVGSTNFCALQSNNSLWCWGVNSTGAVGDGTTTQRNSPVQVSGSWSSVSVSASGIGVNHACGIQTGGGAYCWGDNQYGELGINSDISYVTSPTVLSTTTPLLGTSWTTLVAGPNMTCGTRNTGNVYCWGLNQYGRLGDPNFGLYITPVSAQ